MRVLAAIAISIVFASLAPAEVFVNVYRCDGKTPLAPKDPNTPHVYSDVMMGTRLVLVVSSDKPWQEITGWWGGLQSTWDDWERGKLLGRGHDPNSPALNYRDSYLPAAGIPVRPPIPFPDHEPIVAFVEYSEFDLNRVGFELTTLRDAFAGDWFVLDYVAEKVGSSNVGLFDYGLSFDVPKETHSFVHVPSRDFNGNGIVDFADFASLASHWRQPVDPNAEPSRPRDLDGNLSVGFSDLAMFSEYWLERTDCTGPAAEPGAPAGGL